MQELEIFHEAVKNPDFIASKIKSKGKKILGFLCSYAPVELIYAGGFHPMRLFSSKTEINLADNHLQAYCCSLVRGILEDSLTGKLNFLSGTVFPHTCDSIQRLSDIWRLNGKYSFFADVIMPSKLNTESSKKYMKDVLINFKNDLEKASGENISEKDLKASIAKFNLIRKKLKAFYEFNSKNPGIIKGADLNAIVKGSMIMDIDILVELLPKVLSQLEDMTGKSKKASLLNKNKRLILSGSVCDSPDIYDIIESSGGVIVGDDLCTGQRWFEGEVPEGMDSMDALTERYFERIVCPAKHKSNTARGESIIELAEKTRAHGVIFMLLKFCDPHSFDYPYMKEFLDKKGIRNILIETDEHSTNTGQLSTRLETFIQMI